ncbi:hypothetical protein C0J52_26439 [Blattella germanica]|nr:hypothetical protein C0J52_26439 [Blattella germanica]
MARDQGETVNLKHSKSLKLCYENTKKRVKKANAQDKVDQYKTGGGKYVPPSVDESGRRLISELQPQFLPMIHNFDDDIDFHEQVEVVDFHVVNNELEYTTEEVCASASTSINETHGIDTAAVTSHNSDQIPPRNSPPEKNKKEDMRDVFYKRRLECLEEQHALKMEILQLEKRIKLKEAEKC